MTKLNNFWIFSIVGGMQVEEINDSVVFKIHVSHEVQLPNSTSNPALHVKIFAASFSFTAG